MYANRTQSSEAGTVHWVIAAALVAVTLAYAVPVAPAHVTYTNAAGTQVDVAWRTVAQAASTVDYGTTTAYGSTATGSSFQNGSAYQHHVALTGLAPGTQYYYRYEGRQASFRTPPAAAEPFTFVVPGDIQGWNGTQASWTGCATWLAANQDALFWIPQGDMVSDGPEQGMWDYLFRNSAAIVQKWVMMPVVGNHDCNGERPQNYLDQFRTPPNGSTDLANLYYAFEAGNALFVVMLNNYEADTWFPTRTSAQTTWLGQVLSASAKEWKFVFMHDPSYPSAWTTLMDQHGVDVVFTGHTHSYGESYRGSTFLYSTAGFANQGTNLICAASVNGTQCVVTTYNWQTGAVYSQELLGTPVSARSRAGARAPAARATGGTRMVLVAGDRVRTGADVGSAGLCDLRGRAVEARGLSRQGVYCAIVGPR